MNRYDVMIGSRYVPGGGVEGEFNLKRKFMSTGINLYARFFLGLKTKDNSGSFRCYRVAKLKEIARRKRDHGPFDPDFQPPYSSIHTGLIHGGTALNIVPKDCEFDFEIRPLPGDDVAGFIAELREFAATKILPEMRAVQAHTDIVIDELSAAPALSTPLDAEVNGYVACCARWAEERCRLWHLEHGARA